MPTILASFKIITLADTTGVYTCGLVLVRVKCTCTCTSCWVLVTTYIIGWFTCLNEHIIVSWTIRTIVNKMWNTCWSQSLSRALFWVVQSLIVLYLCKEPRLSGLEFSSEVRRCLVTELTLLPCVVIIHLTMWSMFRILQSKRPWVLEIYGPKYGGGRLHGEAIYMYTVYYNNYTWTIGSSKMGVGTYTDKGTWENTEQFFKCQSL